MIFFLVEGYGYTRSKGRYAARLLLFAVISEAPYCLALTESGVVSFCGLNMLFTLLLCFGLIWAMDNFKSVPLRIIFSVLAILLSLPCSWAVLAPIYTLLFIWAGNSEKRKKAAFSAAAVLFGSMNFFGGISNFTAAQNIVYALLAMVGTGAAGICIMFFYSGKKSGKCGNFSKWFFYVFYLAHLLALGLIRLIVQG